MTNQSSRPLNATKILIACFFIVAVIVPLFAMFWNLASADLVKIFSDPATGTAVVRSVAVSVTSTLISVFLAFAVAWCMNRTGVKLKGFFNILLTLPMLIPSISHGMGLIILFGSNGRLTNLFGLDQGIYGFWGIVVGSVMYSFPIAYLMISDILKYEDSTPYEAAAVLGISQFRRMTAITLPYLRKPMINVIFATFTLIVTDYGVPIMIGGRYKTLPVLMYEEVIGRQDFAKGSVFGAILLIPALCAFIIDLFCRRNSNTSFVSKPFEIKKNKFRDFFAYLFLIILSFSVVYPIFSFIQITFAQRYPVNMSFTFTNILSTIHKGALTFVGNSLIIAVVVALAGTVISFMCAYFTARMPGKSSSFLHLMSITSLAVPGLVLGLSYVLAFKGSIIYKTMAILVLVNIIHFFSSPYLMIYNSFGKLNMNLESVGATLGIGRFRMIRDVFIPQTKSTVIEMFSYFFVNSMMTISAVAFLATQKTQPVSLMINQFEAQSLLEASAFVSLLILVVNLLMKGTVRLIKSKMNKNVITEKKNVD